MNAGMLLTIAIYLGGMIYIGWRFSKKTSDTDDFFLGGRKLGPLVTAMSAEASDMSSYLLMGLPGLAYLTGVADVGWTIIGLAAGTYLNWLLTARRLRRYSERTGSITIPAFFSDRYHDKKRVLQLIAAVTIIIFFVPYTASGFAACGKLFATLFGMNYHLAMILSAIVIITYTMLGGFMAASTTDFIQSIIMSLALVMILFFGISVAGGWDRVVANAASLPGYLSMTQTHDPVTKTAAPYGFLTICSTLAWGLGYFGMPHILLRFMAIRDENKIPLSRRIASVWVVISMTVSVIIGIVGLAVSTQGTIPMLEGSASETIIVQLSSLIARKGFVFAMVAGLVIAGILASTMSTADSQLLAASSSVSSDIMQDYMHMNISNDRKLRVSRITLAVIAVIGIILAWNSDSNVFRIVSFAWAGFGAAFGPVMMLALFWKRSTGSGALCGMIAGGAMVFIWKFLVRPLGGAFDIYELLPAFVIALAVNVVVSLLSPKPNPQIQKEFEEVRRK